MLDLTIDDEHKLGLKPPPIRESGFLIRVNPNQLYFSVFPDRRGIPNTERFKRIIDVLSNFLNLSIIYNQEELERFLEWYNFNPNQMESVGNFLFRERQIGEYFIYDVLEKGLQSKFPFFQIFSKGEKLTRKPDLPIRIDSGCQIGQVYDDGGCDCRLQFLNALYNGFFLFHLPIQDGRGWGMVTKMKTEEYKRQGFDTISAAKDFFEDVPYDIRDYRVVGNFLKEFGVDSVILNTDNRRKLEALESVGIEVTRQETGTLSFCGEGNEELARHIRAKHNTGDYF